MTILSLHLRRCEQWASLIFWAERRESYITNWKEMKAFIMNPSNTVTIGTTGPTPVLVSYQPASVEGDITFQVTTVIESLAANTWRVTVTVTWRH